MKLHDDETGMSAIETAIIMIAFVVVASIFAFTLLSAGNFATERANEAVFAGLAQVRGSMQVRGQLIALAGTTGVNGTIDSLVFTVSNVAGGTPVDLTDTGGENKAVIDYRDENQRQTDLSWSVNWLVGDGDILLEQGELAEITVSNLDATLSPPLSVNTTFVLEVKPPLGGILVLERLTPPYIDPVVELR